MENSIIREELIGRKARIIACSDPSWITISGKIIDETKNTFLIEVNNKPKRIAKKIAIFEFSHQGRKTIVEGSRLIYRPEDRIKKAR
jgi:ribonuclease P protein subunit POP4